MQVLTSLSGLPISANSAGYAPTNSADVSAIASAYVESAVSGKQDSLTFAYNADSAISSINGSALAGQGGGGMITSIQSARNPWWQTSISGLNGSSLYPNWAESAETARNAVSAGYATEAGSAGAAPTAWASSFITGVSSPSGTIRVMGGTAIESTNSAVMPSTVFEGFSTSFGGTTIGPGVKANYVFPTANPSTEIIVSLSYNTGLVLWSSDNGIEGSQEKGDSPETFTAQVPNATAVDIWADAWIGVGSVTASAATQEIGGGVAELAWASSLPTYSYDAENKISGINGSAIAGGAGGVDSATVSAIASSYAESAASGKLDASASSSFYTTANESGFLTGVDLSPYQTTAGMSGYIPTSLSSDFQQVTGMSSYVPYSSIGYNTASAISGINGSALAGTTYSAGTGIDITDDVISVEAPVDIVAGPGIVIDNPDGNTLRVSQATNYEVTLFENASGASANIVCSEKMSNFDRVRFYLYPNENTINSEYTTEFAGNSTIFRLARLQYNNGGSFPFVIYGSYYSTTDSKTITIGSSEHIWFSQSWVVGGTASAASPIKFVKIVGIHRTASN